MAVQIDVTQPVTAPTNITTTLVEGGNLEPNTTYYYIMISFYSSTHTNMTYGYRNNYHSDISPEGSFTTTSTQKSVKFNWTNVTDAQRYQVLLTKTSGDYTYSGGYGLDANGISSDWSDGTVGVTVTDESVDYHMLHSIQLVNKLVGDLRKDTGIIQVKLKGSGTIYPEQIYQAVVAAGYGDWIKYDGNSFILKGFIDIPYGWATDPVNDIGMLDFHKKNVTFIHGGVTNYSPYFVVRFGVWDTTNGGSEYNRCVIDVQNSRQPFFGIYDKLEVYGSQIVYGYNINTDLTEHLNRGWYDMGYAIMIGHNVEKMKDNQNSITYRSLSSRVYDTKFRQGNNYSNKAYIRDEITSYSTAMPYTSTFEGFYKCKWTAPNCLFISYQPPYESHWHIGLYDNYFLRYDDNFIDTNDVWWYMYADDGKSDNDLHIYYSLYVDVYDKQGNPLSGATITMTDVSGNTGIFYAHEGDPDRVVTGDEETTISTDANGKADYYIKSYKLYYDPDYEWGGGHTVKDAALREEFFPYHLTVSYPGKLDYTAVIDKITDEVKLKVYMDAPTYYDGSIELNLTDDTILLEL